MVPAPGETPEGDEVIDQRTATTRTFATDLPGVFVTQQYSSPVNVETDHGWAPIDPALEPDGADGFTNTVDNVDITIATTADADQLAGIELASGASVGFGLDGAATVDADVEGDTATFAGALDGVDVALQSLAGGLKETLTLASAEAPSEFTYQLALDGLAARAEPDGSVSLINPAGVAKVTIPPGSMVDAAGASSDAVTYALSPDGSALVVTADPQWLGDPDRVFPVEVDPTLSLVADADDTYVTQGASPVDQSSSAVLQVGFDGTAAQRAFLHFTGPSTMGGMNVMAADLTLWQSGSGSCTATPIDVYAAAETWAGATTNAWPGPATATNPIATITSGKGHDSSCAAGAVSTDLTRQVDAWVQGESASLGIGLRARDETAAAQHKTFVSADGDTAHRPVLNVLWSDPTLAGRPDDPTDLSPQDFTTSSQPTFSANYDDPEGDAGMVVFFGYVRGTGAFSGALVTNQVDAETTAAVTADYVPLDYPLVWRALSVDLIHGGVSYLSDPVPLVRPSLVITSPSEGEEVSGDITITAQLDPAVTGATGVTFVVNGSAVCTDTSAPYTLAGTTASTPDGDYVLTAQTTGAFPGAPTSSPPVTITIDNPGSPGAPSGSETATELHRTLGVTDESGPAVNSGHGDCGWSERMPDGDVLWLVCDPGGLTSDASNLAGLAPASNPRAPVFNLEPFVVPHGPSCPGDRPIAWPTGVTSFPVESTSGGTVATKVVVFFKRGCADAVLAMSGTEGWNPGTTGVATYIYRNSDTTIRRPASVQTNGRPLWYGRWPAGSGHEGDVNVLHGNGAVYWRNHIYVYACQPQPLDFDHNPPHRIPGYGGCTVARARKSALLGRRDSWSYRSGGNTWTGCPTGCTPAQLHAAEATEHFIQIPSIEPDPIVPVGLCPDYSSPPCPEPVHQPQQFQVVWSPQLHRFVSAHLKFFGANTMRIRTATQPTGPWSLPVDVTMDCNGHPEGELWNCYQVGPHPELTATAPTTTSTMFHYFDHWVGDSHDDEEASAIRFVEVPLCVIDSADTGTGVPEIEYAADQCLMTGGDWNTGVVLQRREVAAILWRLQGFPEPVAGQPVPTRQFTDVADSNKYRQSVDNFEHHDPDYTEVWSTSSHTFSPFTTVTRGELIRLLWRFDGAPPGPFASGSPLPGDWSTSWSADLRAAVSWAYATGVVCDSTFGPAAQIERRTAAGWLHHLRTVSACP